MDVTTLLNTNPYVYADGAQGIPDPLRSTAGWYYKNSDDLTDKINWYYVNNNNPAVTMTLANFTAQYAVIDLRTAAAPFFVVYTKPTGDGNDAGSWYRSRIVSRADMDLTPYVGQIVFLHWGVDTGDFPTLPRVSCVKDPFTTVGPQATTEEILFANISTSTGYPAGTYEFVISDLGYEFNNADVQFILSSLGEVPAAGDTHYVTLDGVNDYITLNGTGSCMDLSAGATWTLGFTVEENYPGNADKQAPISSGTNYWSLYNGGLHSTFGNDVAALNWNTAAYMQGITAGDKIVLRANGTHVQVWWNGVRKHQASLGTQGVTTGGAPGTLEIGKNANTASAGYAPHWATSIDNLMVCGSDALTDAEMSEFFGSNDYALYTFAGTKLTDFVTMGEDTYPNINGELSNVTGTLFNGSTANFVERV